MTWARLDDTFHHHPKFMRVSLAATGLFALGLSYAADNLTDGRLPEKWVLGRTVDDDGGALQELVDEGLWESVEGGYQIHDYDDYNLTLDEAGALRDARSAAGRRGGLARAKALATANGRQASSKGSSKQKGEGATGVGVPGPGSSSASSSSSVGGSPGTRKGSRSTSRSVARTREAEFSEWLEHYRETTGRTDVRGSKAARDQFKARREEWSVEELKQATAGCHSDDFCRENGHDVPETILRASKVERYIQLAKGRSKPSGAEAFVK